MALVAAAEWSFIEEVFSGYRHLGFSDSAIALSHAAAPGQAQDCDAAAFARTTAQSALGTSLWLYLDRVRAWHKRGRLTLYLVLLELPAIINWLCSYRVSVACEATRCN